MTLFSEFHWIFDGELLHLLYPFLAGGGLVCLIFLGILLPVYLLVLHFRGPRIPQSVGQTAEPELIPFAVEPLAEEPFSTPWNEEGTADALSVDALSVDAPPPSDPQASLILEAQALSNNARSGLMQLGIHIKNMLKEAQTLAFTAGKSKSQIDETCEYTAKLVEAAHELQPLLSTLTDKPELLKRANELSEILKNLSEKTHSVSKTLSSYHPETLKATEALNDHVSKTTQALLDQAKIIQDFKERCGRLSK